MVPTGESRPVENPYNEPVLAQIKETLAPIYMQEMGSAYGGYVEGAPDTPAMVAHSKLGRALSALGKNLPGAITAGRASQEISAAIAAVDEAGATFKQLGLTDLASPISRLRNGIIFNLGQIGKR